jgi:hypothetical protein
VSERLSYSFSDLGGGLHSFGVQDGHAIVFAADQTSTQGAVEMVASDLSNGRFEVKMDGVYVASLDALGAPVTFAGDGRRTWFCRVGGRARSSAGEVALSGYGAVSVGERELGGLGLRRSIWTSFGEELAFVVSAERPRKKHGHGDEQVSGFALRGAPLVASAIEEPLVSSTWAGDGGLLRVGLELWESDDDDARALRIGGETVAAGELADTGHERVSVAFLVCQHAGQRGIGCYELVRRPA